MKISRIAMQLASVTLLAYGPCQAQAATLYATDFEAPVFSTGQLNGQNGWAALNSNAVSHVVNTTALSGSQAVSVIPALASVQDGALYALSSSAPVIVQSADIYLFSSSNQSAWQFAATGQNVTGFIGGIDVQPDDTIALITPGFPAASASFVRNQWNHVDLTLDFISQTWSFALNGSTLASNLPFCGNNSDPCNGAAVTGYGDGLFDAFPALDGNGNNIANDLGVMDNYSVQAVPEPQEAILMLAGLALVGAVARRRARC